MKRLAATAAVATAAAAVAALLWRARRRRDDATDDARRPPPPPLVRAIVLDLDGTLLDTTDGLTTAVGAGLRAVGVDAPAAAIRAIMGSPLEVRAAAGSHAGPAGDVTWR